MFKVALDSQIFTQQVYGGISRYFVNLTEHLEKFGVEAKIFSDNYINSYLRDAPSNLFEGQPRPPHRVFPRFIHRMSSQLSSNRKIKKWNPKIVHKTYYLPFNNSLRHIPSVLTVFDLTHEKYPQFLKSSTALAFLKKQAIEYFETL